MQLNGRKDYTLSKRVAAFFLNNAARCSNCSLLSEKFTNLLCSVLSVSLFFSINLHRTGKTLVYCTETKVVQFRRELRILQTASWYYEALRTAYTFRSVPNERAHVYTRFLHRIFSPPSAYIRETNVAKTIVPVSFRLLLFSLSLSLSLSSWRYQEPLDFLL